MPLGIALLLALVQGLTEFLPVSSSAHLSLLQSFSGLFEEPPVLFDVWLHLATIAAVLVYYRKRLLSYLKLERLTALLLATFITGCLGLALRPWAEKAFGLPALVGLFLAATGAYLWFTSCRASSDPRPLTFRRAAWIGLTQGLAVFPGLSRSGLTICTGVNLGMAPRAAAEFSFILSVPAVFMANALEFWSHRAEAASADWGVYGAAFLLAFAAGFGAIRLTEHVFSRNRLKPFAVYCIIVAAVAIILYAYRTLS